MLDDVDLLVCGAGPVGCVVAERAAHLLGWKVLIVERRPHIAGNCFDSRHVSSLLIHNYGPHYFRTNDAALVRYLSRFTDWIPGNYVVKSLVRGQLLPFPINLTTLERFFDRELDPAAAERLLQEKRLPCAQPANSDEFVLSRVGRELYESFYLNYTRKQWNLHPRDLDASVCGRIPVRFNRNECYVDHRFQIMPKRGFTALFDKMLRHPNIRVLLDADFREIRGLVEPWRATVYTGPIDAYFDCCFGKLPYRSLKFDVVLYATEFKQPCVQINYPNDFAWTRSVEFKYVTGQQHPATVVSYETPRAAGEPYYPVPTAASQALYRRYQELAARETHQRRVYFCGRLAQYRYFNTDEVIQEALRCFEDIKTNCRPPSICLVVPVMNAAAPLARSLAQAGWRVHVLHGGVESCSGEAAALANVTVHELADVLCPEALTLPGPNEIPQLDLSDRVRFAVADLYKTHSFDLIQFSTEGGLGFRGIQAKKLGLEFLDVPLLVLLDDTGQELRRGRQQWIERPEDLAGDYSERYAFEQADVQVVAAAPRLQAIQQHGWQVSDAVRVLPALADWPAFYAAVLASRRVDPGDANKSQHLVAPLVTVSVAYYNLAPFLSEALQSLATQSYPQLDVLVINDGSTDPAAQRVFRELQGRFPHFQFLEQANAGIGATRNRGLDLARGEYFLPMDADNVARPDMVARLVDGLQRQPDLAALTSYFLAFADSADLAAERFLYAYKPSGGPHVLGCLRNVYGDGNALFRTAALRAIGGFTTDRNASFEDWETFVRLVNAGQRVDVLPEFLFYYRHREAGFSRVTSSFRNRQRVLRQYVQIDALPRAERLALWNLLMGLYLRQDMQEVENRTLRARLRSKRYRVMDRLNALMRHVPGWPPAVRWVWDQWYKGREAAETRV